MQRNSLTRCPDQDPAKWKNPLDFRTIEAKQDLAGWILTRLDRRAIGARPARGLARRELIREAMEGHQAGLGFQTGFRQFSG